MRSFAWMTPLALAALVACADQGGETETGDMEAVGTETEEAAADVAEAGTLACAPTQTGEELTGRSSPYDSVSVPVGSGEAKICYSRPALRGRTMIGGDAVPYNRLWRFGANEPTIIHLSTAASIAGAEVEPGSYSIYTIPQKQGDWTLIVNRSTSQWGHEGRYTAEVEAQEVARVPVRSDTVEQTVEQFTIRPAPEGSGVVAEWQDSRIVIPIEPAR